MRFTVLLAAPVAMLFASHAQAQSADQSAPQDSTPLTLGEIVVTGSPLKDVTIGSSTLSSEAIYQFDRTTLDDAANLIPGVNVANTGGPRNERTILVRGFNRFEVPLSIDGIRVFLPADNRLDYGRFLTPDIAQIQVAKGYASVLDGPGAMGGAVNLVTRKPTRPLEIEAQGMLNLDHDVDYAGYNVFGLVGTKHDKWYAQASYSRNFVDHQDLSGDFTPTTTQAAGERDLSRSSDWRVNGKIGFTPNATDEYVLNYTRQEGSKLAPFSVNPGDSQRDWTWPYWNIDSLYFLSTTALDGVATLKTKIYRNTFDNLLSSFDNAAEDTQTLPKAFNSYYADTAYGGSAELDLTISPVDRFSLAAFYRRDKHVEWQQGFPGGTVEPHQTSIEETYSIAAENCWTVAPAIELKLGASYDWKNLVQAEDYANNALIHYPLVSRGAWNAQGTLSWHPDADSELHVSISDRVRFPTLFERFSSRFGGAVSNPALKPERAVNYEIGGSRRFGIVKAEGALFYSHLTDVIVSFPFTYQGQPVTQSRNLGHGNYYGAELSLSAQVTPSLSIGGNYTYTHRDLDDPTDSAFRPTDVPTDKAFVYADWAPVARFHILPSADIASNRWTTNALAATGAGTLYFRTGSYVNVALKFDYDVTSAIDIGIGVRNLLDRNYELVDGFPEPGRSFYVTARALY
jgi:iron complex outermembrane receptor protein